MQRTLQAAARSRSSRQSASRLLVLQVDIAVVEAGLGGARDATNVFEPEQLKAAIVTAVGLEHQAALGAGFR